MAVDDAIDHEHPVVRRTVATLSADARDAYAYAEAAFTFVRYQKFEAVHGLIALKLPGRERWVWQDARGGEAGAGAQFRLDREQLAFAVRPEFNEVDHPVLFAEPHPAVLQCLRDAVDQRRLTQLLPTAL
ncbi:hypothetical protein [Streptomyces lydicus]|uniref:hypothetical protein n=1 Tax=Streptomyces lydicus TaxID=47763 RepID=UPI0037ACE1BA